MAPNFKYPVLLKFFYSEDFFKALVEAKLERNDPYQLQVLTRTCKPSQIPKPTKKVFDANVPVSMLGKDAMPIIPSKKSSFIPTPKRLFVLQKKIESEQNPIMDIYFASISPLKNYPERLDNITTNSNNSKSCRPSQIPKPFLYGFGEVPKKNLGKKQLPTIASKKPSKLPVPKRLVALKIREEISKHTTALQKKVSALNAMKGDFIRTSKLMARCAC